MKIDCLLLMCRHQLFLTNCDGIAAEERSQVRSDVCLCNGSSAAWGFTQSHDQVFGLGAAGGVMMGVDAASFDVTTVMASVLGMTVLSAYRILPVCLPQQCVSPCCLLH
jgi:hypothetical protein